MFRMYAHAEIQVAQALGSEQKLWRYIKLGVH
jgi:hypothetical protein